ncbi:MAG: hypothetical protein ISS66_08655 [Desulfobacteraceae bacterium]|nr:hypothetical protein [Desulfobacteraceae bacterium]
MLAIIALISHHSGGWASFGNPEAAKWLEQSDRYAGSDTIARALTDVHMGEIKITTGMFARQFALISEGVHLIDRVLELARRLGDSETFFHVSSTWLLQLRLPQRADERLQLVEEMLERSRTGMTFGALEGSKFFCIDTYIEFGQRQKAEEQFDELKRITERSQQANFLITSTFIDSVIAFLDGRLEDAVEISQRCRALGEQLGIPAFGAALGFLSEGRPKLHLGKIDEVLPQLGYYPSFWPASYLAALGRNAEVAEILQQWVMERPGLGTSEDMFGYYYDVHLLSAAVTTRHHKAAELLLRRLSGSNLCTTGIFDPTCVPRHLGGAAALLGRSDEARKYYQEAIKVTTEMPFRPELALTRLQLTELLLEHYPEERAEALEHLDFAISELHEMKMKPSLEKAQALKERF